MTARHAARGLAPARSHRCGACCHGYGHNRRGCTAAPEQTTESATP